MKYFSFLICMFFVMGCSMLKNLPVDADICETICYEAEEAGCELMFQSFGSSETNKNLIDMACEIGCHAAFGDRIEKGKFGSFDPTFVACLTCPGMPRCQE